MKAMTIYQQLHQLTLRTSSHNHKTTLQKNEIPLEISEKKIFHHMDSGNQNNGALMILK